jgi:pyruvate,water dikinase
MSLLELHFVARREGAPAVVWLDDPAATNPATAGAKGAALAVASSHGLPVLPGFVVTTTATREIADAGMADEVASEVHGSWAQLAADGARPLVVRSSSTVEDGGTTSMAGVFTSVLDVHGWPDFVEALGDVLGSAKAVPGIEMAPMAVLVQPMLEPSFGGVLFGADPVTGRRDRLVIAAVPGGPNRLVSGEVDGAQYVLTAEGKVRSSESALPGLGKAHMRDLAGLAHRSAEVFGGPQDIEWAVETNGTLRLLQARPITTLGGDPTEATGPVLGPGPVAETFPAALSPLEEDLWLDPLREGIVTALRLTAAASGRSLGRSPVVVSVGGRVAADLDLLGVRSPKHRLLAKLNPLPPARRLGAAWRVGRLRSALPMIGADILADVDDQLLAVPSVAELDDGQVVGLLDRAQGALAAVHGNEVLAGLLAGSAEASITGAGAALAALAAGRSAALTDDEIVAATPVVLALVPPAIGAPAELPATPPRLPAAVGHLGDHRADDLAVLREAFRLRARWLHELTARAAFELGLRLHERGVIAAADDVRWLRRAELLAALEGRGADLRASISARRSVGSPAPLPTEFRLTPDNVPVAVRSGSSDSGRGAGGGRGSGPVHQGPGTPEAGAVLLVRTLDPDLATVLPHLGGLVAETGSVLSHLAILAREFGVPTVVGVPDALRRFPAGHTVLVDGGTGEVTLLDTSSTPELEGGVR